MRVLEAEVILNLELYKSRFILFILYLDNYDFKTCLNWTK